MAFRSAQMFREVILEGLRSERRRAGFKSLIGILNDPTSPPAAGMEEYLRETWADSIERSHRQH